MNAEQLQQVGLTKGIGYKVKCIPPNFVEERCFMRWLPDQQRWQEYITGLTYTEEEAIKILAYEMKFGTLTFFMCCCPQCSNGATKLFAEQFQNQTGEKISHGLAPEHRAGERERMLTEMAAWRESR